ncbi:MAG: hypothetical protein C0501_20740 [Isosphaera sp.]|nr:hypothetical protein [Isosphaera sp.]
MSFSGLFELKTPADLFRKLEHDLRRLEADALDAYAAFDFFVTAEHMLDWVYPDDPDARAAARQSDPLLEVCSHLANGSKHFRATHPRHRSVDDTRQHGGAFSSAFSRGFDISRLEVDLKGDAAAALGSVVEVTDLARAVLCHWRSRLGLS